MGLLRKVLLRPFRSLTTLSDVAMVATAAGRMAKRRSGGSPRSQSTGEMALLAGATFRILRRMRRRRKSRRLAASE